MKRLRPVLLILVILAAAALWIYEHPRPRPGVIEGSGTIEATQVDLAPKVAGRVTRITVIEGDVVKAGTVVAVLDGVDLQDQLEQAHAAWQQAQARLQEAQSDLTLERRQYSAALEQARATAAAGGPRVPQAAASARLQQGTVLAQIQQVQAQVSASQASQAAAVGNARASEQTWRAAQANLRTAQAALDRALQDDARYEKLFLQDAIPAQQLDTARTTVRSAQGQRDAARDQVNAAQAQRDAASQQQKAAGAAVTQSQAALQQAEINQQTVPIRQLDVATSQAQLEQAQAGIGVAQAAGARIDQRRHQVQEARAAVAQSLAALHLAQTARGNATLKAPFDCTVLSKDVEVGDLVSVGAPVVTIADLQHPYLRVFISEADVAHVRLGQQAEVRIDGFPGRVFAAAVDEIRNKAEYTPTNVQTRDERAKLVFGVRLTLKNEDGVLKPGLPADAVILTPTAAR